MEYVGIRYKGISYLARGIDFDGEYILISSLSLDKALFNNDSYPDDEARHIDETICFFVDDVELMRSDDYLYSILKNNL